MSIATDILSLRRDQSSSVSALLAAIEWECAAEEDIRILARGYDVMRMAGEGNQAVVGLFLVRWTNPVDVEYSGQF
jgi:hypothetical protein